MMVLKRGIDYCRLSDNCSKRGERKEEIIQKSVKDDFCTIAGKGFDFVRIPLDYSFLFNGYGEKIEEHFNLIDQAIGFCVIQDLKVVLELPEEKRNTESSDRRLILNKAEFPADYYEMQKMMHNKRNVDRTYFLWRNILQRYGHLESVAFRLPDGSTVTGKGELAVV